MRALAAQTARSRCKVLSIVCTVRLS